MKISAEEKKLQGGVEKVERNLNLNQKTKNKKTLSINTRGSMIIQFRNTEYYFVCLENILKNQRFIWQIFLGWGGGVLALCKNAVSIFYSHKMRCGGFLKKLKFLPFLKITCIKVVFYQISNSSFNRIRYSLGFLEKIMFHFFLKLTYIKVRFLENTQFFFQIT